LRSESAVVVFVGPVVAAALATLSLAALQQAAPTNIPRLASISIDVPVLLFTFGMALVTGVIVGVAPAWRGASANQSDALKEGGRSGGEGSRGRRVRHVLAAIEVAVALVLLV